MPSPSPKRPRPRLSPDRRASEGVTIQGEVPKGATGCLGEGIMSFEPRETAESSSPSPILHPRQGALSAAVSQQHDMGSLAPCYRAGALKALSKPPRTTPERGRVPAEEAGAEGPRSCKGKNERDVGPFWARGRSVLRQSRPGTVGGNAVFGHKH